MKLKHVKAVFFKQIMDISHNVGVIIQFAIFPILLCVIVFIISADYKTIQPTMVMLISSSFISIVPMMTVRNIIYGDKTQNVLRALILSNVKPFEYLLGINLFIVIISICTSFLLGFIGGFSGITLIKYVGAMILGVVTTLFFGSTLAIQSSFNSASEVGIIAVSLLNSIIPILGMFSPTIQNIAKFVYTYQINNLIGDIYGNYFDWTRVLIIGVNLLLFLLLFAFSYKKNKLCE